MSRISSCHTRLCDPPVRRRRAVGFTLVELLVVISIIVLLMALLLPVLSRVREAGKRAKCSANLHSIGQMATTFANDHRGYFPACFRMHDTTAPPAAKAETFPFRVPQFISLDSTHDPDDSPYGWQQFGTSWAMWQTYNATLELFTCPSSNVLPHEVDLATSSTQSQYGNLISTNYMYVGGLSDQNMQVPLNVIGSNHSVSHWGKAPPAVSTSGAPLYAFEADPNNAAGIITVPVGVAPLGITVLATDMVYFTGTTGAGKGVYIINHPRNGDPSLPDCQNVLYGDGRVESHGREEYPAPLNDDTGTIKMPGVTAPAQYSYDWSMKFADGQPGFYFWGEPESDPLMSGLKPPTTDVIPPDPNQGGGAGFNNFPKGAIVSPIVPSTPVEPGTEGNPGPLPS